LLVDGNLKVELVHLPKEQLRKQRNVTS